MSSIEIFPLMSSYGFGSGPKQTEVIKLFFCSLLFLYQSFQFHYDAIQAFMENGPIFYRVTLTRLMANNNIQEYQYSLFSTFQLMPHLGSVS